MKALSEVLIKLYALTVEFLPNEQQLADRLAGSVSVSVEIQMSRIGLRTRQTVASNPERE